MGWTLIVVIGGVVIALACAGVCIVFFVKNIYKVDGGFHLASNEGSNTVCKVLLFYITLKKKKKRFSIKITYRYKKNGLKKKKIYL